jgi:two-component sensor histidine kinase/PAS domain-containing protein
MSNPSTNYATILQGMPQPYLVLDADLTIVGASDAYLVLTDRIREDIVGHSILVAFPQNPDDTGAVEQGPLGVSLRHVLATGKPHEMAVIQYDIPRPAGGFVQRFWTPVHTPVMAPDGRIEYIIQNPMDVTESVVKGREADARLRVAMHAADLASWEYEPGTDIRGRSHAVDELFGFEAGQGGPVAAPFFARIHSDDLPAVTQNIRDIMQCPDRTITRFDYRISLPTGEVKHVASRGEVLRTSNGDIRIIGVMMDITADRLREMELARALETQSALVAQKELLLAEVNHRVKNSLQLVVSTLRLQARRLEDPKISQAFDQAISRVRAIISVHERLYRTDNSMTVDMANHLSKMCQDLTGDTPSRPVVVDVGAMELPTERAIPISVIVNELLSNSLNHAGDTTGRIAVSLEEKSGVVQLTVSGPEPASAASVSDLGGQLIKSMAAQIDGSISEEASPEGYHFRLVFPKDGA